MRKRSERETPRSRTLEIARLLWEHTDADHGLTIKEMQGDVSPAASGLDRYVPGNLAEVGCPAERKAVSLSLHQLACAGFPVKKARNGNRHEYRLARHVLDEHELGLVLAAVQSSHALSERTARRIQEKLASLASNDQAARARERAITAVHVRRQQESALEKLEPIERAISDKKRLFFKYYEYDGQKKRVPRAHCNHDVTPVLVAYSEGYYYLVAYSDDAQSAGMRTYRIDLMGSLRPLDEPAQTNAQITELKTDPSRALDPLFSMFDAESANVTLRVETRLMRSVIDRFGADFPTYPDKGDPQRCTRVVVQAGLSPTFFAWVAQFEGGVTIEQPAAARRAMRAFLEHGLDAHSRSGAGKGADAEGAKGAAAST